VLHGLGLPARWRLFDGVLLRRSWLDLLL